MSFASASESSQRRAASSSRSRTSRSRVAVARSSVQPGRVLVNIGRLGVVADGDTLDLGRLKATVEALRSETNLVVQLSTGGSVHDPEEHRLRVLEAMPDSASCTMGTVNFGDDVFMNRWEFIVALHKGMQERGIVPEYEIFDIGQLASLKRLLDQHGLPAGGHVHVDFVVGVPGGMPGDAATLVAAVNALPDGATFSATGIGRTTIPVMFTALGAGGHLRVGMEDTISYSRGVPVRDNAQLVARAAGLAKIAQRPALSPDETRKLLGVHI